MKTTLHLHRAPPAPAPASTAASTARRTSTLRLGLVVSVVAAVVAVVVEALADVPVAVLLIPVVAVGFALSWHASGRLHDPGER